MVAHYFYYFKFFKEIFFFMAEREGFEPSIVLPLYTLSKRAPSTTRPPLQLLFHMIYHNKIKGCEENCFLYCSYVNLKVEVYFQKKFLLNILFILWQNSIKKLYKEDGGK